MEIEHFENVRFKVSIELGDLFLPVRVDDLYGFVIVFALEEIETRPWIRALFCELR